MQEDSLFSTPSPALIVCRLFGSSHSDRCEMVPHCGFDLHFSDNEWCWASFHIFVSHLYVFLEKCLFSSLAHFLIGSIIFLGLSCRSCLYIFQINYLSVVSFAIIFSHSEGCLLILLIVSFIVQKLLSLFKSHFLFLLFFHESGMWVIEDPAVIYVRECFAYDFLLEFYSFWS